MLFSIDSFVKNFIRSLLSKSKCENTKDASAQQLPASHRWWVRYPWQDPDYVGSAICTRCGVSMDLDYDAEWDELHPERNVCSDCATVVMSEALNRLDAHDIINYPASIDEYYQIIWDTCERFSLASVVSGNPATYEDEFEFGKNPLLVATELMLTASRPVEFQEGCAALERHLILGSILKYEDNLWHLYPLGGKKGVLHAVSLESLILHLGKVSLAY